jgi:hypothetical protein
MAVLVHADEQNSGIATMMKFESSDLTLNKRAQRGTW